MALTATAQSGGTLKNARQKDNSQPKSSSTKKLTPPSGDKKIVVAFVLTEGATMIDFAGPWEVFQDVGAEKAPNPFELITVGESKSPIRTSGGMLITPDFAFSDVPTPNVVVIPAQRGSTRLNAWLKDVAKKSDVVMSVCTGAFHLAKSGLLDGKSATTHHDFYTKFQQAFPQTKLIKGRRYVQSDETIYTAGGLTSGIDLALHVVGEYLGRDIAKQTAEYMEYEGVSWMK
jgi:transcriptional regulator GlxA family with amidase domain